MSKTFKIVAQDSLSSARTGIIDTPHGAIETPAFAPVASQGTIKALIHKELTELGVQLILVNSYHLYLRPGVEVIEKLGGLHSFISWPKPILTDSGGFQIYSLSPLARVKKEGVTFASHLDGTKIFLTPEDIIEMQWRLGSDILVTLDYFLPYPSPDEKIKEAVKITSAWAARSKNKFGQLDSSSLLWGITQGSVNWDLRKQCTEALLKINFDGYALGGLGIGEAKAQLMEILEKSDALLPKEKPRYLMGLGYIHDILEAVERGMDLFDCVLPTRNARNGTLFTREGTLVIKNQKYALDKRPIEEGCLCYTCQNYSRAYLRHLYERQEISSSILNTIHNLHFYLDIFRKIRQSIQSNSFQKLKYCIINEFKEVKK